MLNRKSHFEAARRFMKAAADFKEETGFSPLKATEILSAAIANKWLEIQGYSWHIEIESRLRGVDGVVIGRPNGPTAVEFKSTEQRSGEFQFKPDFDFSAHWCVVLSEFSGGIPKRIFMAFGKNAMALLNTILLADARRSSFKNGDMLRIFSKPKAASNSVWLEDVPGMLDSVTIFSPDDQIVLLTAADVESLMERM